MVPEAMDVYEVYSQIIGHGYLTDLEDCLVNCGGHVGGGVGTYRIPPKVFRERSAVPELGALTQLHRF